MPKKKYTKKQKGGMESSRRSRSRSGSRPRARSRSRARSGSRSGSRGRRRIPIDQDLFQNEQQVDPIAMNVYNNTQAIKNLMDDIQVIKRALLLIPTIQGALNVSPSPRVSGVVKEVEG